MHSFQEFILIQNTAAASTTNHKTNLDHFHKRLNKELHGEQPILAASHQGKNTVKKLKCKT